MFRYEYPVKKTERTLTHDRSEKFDRSVPEVGGFIA